MSHFEFTGGDPGVKIGNIVHAVPDDGFSDKPGGCQDIVNHAEFTGGDPGDKNGTIDHFVFNGGFSGMPGGGQDVENDSDLTVCDCVLFQYCGFGTTLPRPVFP